MFQRPDCRRASSILAVGGQYALYDPPKIRSQSHVGGIKVGLLS